MSSLGAPRVVSGIDFGVYYRENFGFGLNGTAFDLGAVTEKPVGIFLNVLVAE